MKKLSTVILIGLSLFTSSVVFADIPEGLAEALMTCSVNQACVAVVKAAQKNCPKGSSCAAQLKAKAKQYCTTNECKKP